MATITFDHTKHINPARLATLVGLLDCSTRVGRLSLTEHEKSEVRTALSQYESILQQAYLQSLNESYGDIEEGETRG